MLYRSQVLATNCSPIELFATLFAQVDIAVVSADCCWGCIWQQKCVTQRNRSCRILQFTVMLFWYEGGKTQQKLTLF